MSGRGSRILIEAGFVVRNSEGRNRKKMKIGLKRLGLGAVMAGALTVALPAAPALAVDEVACGHDDGLVKVTYQENGTEHSRCWENLGGFSLYQDDVTSFSSGDYEVVVAWIGSSGPWQVELLPPHTSATFNGVENPTVWGFVIRDPQ